RAQLLNYFGQRAEPCGNCDTCLNPPESWDGTVAAQKLLSTVYRLRHERDQGFGAAHLIDIVRGRRTPKVEQFGHGSLTGFGVGADLGEDEWRGVIRQLMAHGLLAVEPRHQTCVLTEGGREVLFRGRRVMMRRDPKRQARRQAQPRSERTAAIELSVEAT